MIYAIKTKCWVCGFEFLLLINDNSLIDAPFICTKCFDEKVKSHIRIKHVKLAIGGKIEEHKMFYGYRIKDNDYKLIYPKSH